MRRDRELRFLFSFILLASTIFTYHALLLYFIILMYFHFFSLSTFFFLCWVPFVSTRRSVASILPAECKRIQCCHYHQQHQSECRAINDTKSMTRCGNKTRTRTNGCEIYAMMSGQSGEVRERMESLQTASQTKCEMNDDDFSIDNMQSHMFALSVDVPSPYTRWPSKSTSLKFKSQTPFIR